MTYGTLYIYTNRVKKITGITLANRNLLDYPVMTDFLRYFVVVCIFKVMIIKGF